MKDKKRFAVRVSDEKHKSFLLYCLQHDTSAQQVLESYVDILLELGINPTEAIRRIEEEKESE
jgi:hypothetical protein